MVCPRNETADVFALEGVKNPCWDSEIANRAKWFDNSGAANRLRAAASAPQAVRVRAVVGSSCCLPPCRATYCVVSRTPTIVVSSPPNHAGAVAENPSLFFFYRHLFFSPSYGPRLGLKRRKATRVFSSQSRDFCCVRPMHRPSPLLGPQSRFGDKLLGI